MALSPTRAMGIFGMDGFARKRESEWMISRRAFCKDSIFPLGTWKQFGDRCPVIAPLSLDFLRRGDGQRQVSDLQHSWWVSMGRPTQRGVKFHLRSFLAA